MSEGNVGKLKDSKEPKVKRYRLLRQGNKESVLGTSGTKGTPTQPKAVTAEILQ